MRLVSRFLAILTLSAASLAAHSQQFTETYANLGWGFSSGAFGFSGCTTLFMDATGDFNTSDHFLLYGKLYCPSLGGYYNVDGSGYFSGNTFSLSVDLGVTNKLVCVNLPSSTLTGSCSIYTNDGTFSGSAFINL